MLQLFSILYPQPLKQETVAPLIKQKRCANACWLSSCLSPPPVDSSFTVGSRSTGFFFYSVRAFREGKPPE